MLGIPATQRSPIASSNGNPPPPDERSPADPQSARSRLRRPRVLVADDNESMCQLLADCLDEAGYEVVQCHDGYELTRHLGSYLLPRSREAYDLIISDIRMPHVSGLEILEGLHDQGGTPRMILITAFGDRQTHERARKLGVAAFFDKPFPVQDLVAKVRELVPPGSARGNPGAGGAGEESGE